MWLVEEIENKEVTFGSHSSLPEGTEACGDSNVTVVWMDAKASG
jgi:hypothetical protein